jgi:hypothetical protein
MRRSVMVLLVVAVAAAYPAQGDDRQSERRIAAQTALQDWYSCIECQDGELDKLIRYQDLVEETLTITLKRGPSPARRAEIEARLRSSYRSSPSQTIPENRYVELFMSNMDSKFRARAATALGRIGTESAQRALKEAEQDKNLRQDVRLAAKEALRSGSIR